MNDKWDGITHPTNFNMGIKYLNRFLREKTPNSLTKTHLSHLSGKKIVVDVSIYMYRYASTEHLFENMATMMTIFRTYNIHPLFIFDGTPPAEKKNALMQRKKEKQDAKEKYEVMKQQMETDMDFQAKKQYKKQLQQLKNTFVNITSQNIEAVKKQIVEHGATYMVAKGEADELCAWFVLEGKAWACLSEDMDMFVYGCPRVLRYLSLLNHTCIVYETNSILANLEVTQKEFREMCILSGTDYNGGEKNDTSNEKYDNTDKEGGIHKYYNYLKTYQWLKNNVVNEMEGGFYQWLIQTNQIQVDMVAIQKINNMFELNRETCMMDI
jgi:flap endonuclease-1